MIEPDLVVMYFDERVIIQTHPVSIQYVTSLWDFYSCKINLFSGHLLTCSVLVSDLLVFVHKISEYTFKLVHSRKLNFHY